MTSVDGKEERNCRYGREGEWKRIFSPFSFIADGSWSALGLCTRVAIASHDDSVDVH